MVAFAPDSLARWTGGRWTSAGGEPILGFTIDSRLLRAGQMFVALKTDKRDGHDFLPLAQAAGAAAALVSAPAPALTLPQLVVGDSLAAFQAIAREHRRGFTGPVVGISGSAGKTSTKDLVALLLGGTAADDSPVLSTAGNLNNHLGVPLTLTRLDASVHHYAVIEAGISAPGEMAVLAAMIEPDLAIITLVAPAHLAELGGLEGVAREKARLPAAVRPGGIALFPQACAEFAPFRELSVRTLVVGAEAARSVRGTAGRVSLAISHRVDATEITLGGDVPSAMFSLRRVTDGMARNAALAVCAALRLGVGLGAIRHRLQQWQPAAMRGELRQDGARLLYLDCYNANPASMADALDAFVAIAPPECPRLFVVGSMEELGPESERFHLELGRRLSLRPEDFLLAIGDQAEAVRAGALARGARAEQIAVAASAEPAVAQVREFRGAVFVKGSRKYRLETVLGASDLAAAQRVGADALHP